jgi:FkbM family methyltransferase
MLAGTRTNARALLKDVLQKTPAWSWIKARRARRSLARWTEQDRRMLDFYAGFLAPDELCFDVGANIGNRVKIFLELGARVVAVEPQLECARVLESAFGRHPRFTLVRTALGEKEGHAEMRISDADTISSLSREWIDAVVASGRFASARWDRTSVVPVTTLDALIARYGAPAFVKIDVEGFEHAVVKGLSAPVRALSLEFTPEYIESTLRCLEHLARLGDVRLNLSFAETMQWALDEWVGRAEMIDYLSHLDSGTSIWGDLYARFALRGDDAQPKADRDITG